jgi:hypothetical protein
MNMFSYLNFALEPFRQLTYFGKTGQKEIGVTDRLCDVILEFLPQQQVFGVHPGRKPGLA